MHPDGCAELMDRAKDIVISGGQNISTVEVEQALLSHSAVADAAVIGLPDDRWGERPKAFVILGAGQAADEGELIEHVRSRIVHYRHRTRSSSSPCYPGLRPARSRSTSCSRGSGPREATSISGEFGGTRR